MGGIEIDGSARVISKDGGPIQGLFAAGAATGGLEGGGANAYVGGIVKAGVFGLLAAEEAARVIKKVDVDATVSPQTSRFPVLDMIVRYGNVAAALLGPLTALIAAWPLWSTLGIASVPVALVAGGLVYILVRSYVEIVTLITEMLMPR
jgi:fumarate reductase flavoprotein subunit